MLDTARQAVYTALWRRCTQRPQISSGGLLPTCNPRPTKRKRIEKKREGGRERETDTETEIETDRQTDRHREKKKKKKKQHTFMFPRRLVRSWTSNFLIRSLREKHKHIQKQQLTLFLPIVTS